MSNNTVRKILEREARSRLGCAYLIYWDSINDKPKPGVAFIRATLTGVDSETISMSCQRDFDLFVIQVFTPKGLGADSNFALCDALVTMYRGYSDGNLLCTKVVNERVGKSSEWYQRNIVIDTQYDSNF